MSKGIKMSDCRFYVDKDARTVVCVVADTEEYTIKDMVTDFIADHFRFSDIDFCYALMARLEDKLDMPRSFMGKAVCAPEDEWNEETGKLLAYSRARDKVYKSFFKRANMLVQTVDRRLGNMIEAFNDFGLRLEAKREEIAENVEKRTGVKEE